MSGYDLVRQSIRSTIRSANQDLTLAELPEKPRKKRKKEVKDAAGNLFEAARDVPIVAYDKTKQAAETVRQAPHAAYDKTAEGAAATKERLGAAYDTVKHKASDAAQYAGEKVKQGADAWKEATRAD